MPILDAHEVVDTWVAQGGPKKYAVAWAAVSLAESSWNTDAVSPTDAHGLYQIEPYSWSPEAGPGDRWNQAGPNTLAAIVLSGGGTNFAPWDTAYADIGRSGRYNYLSWPEAGSAAYNNMPKIQAMVGKGGYGPVSKVVTPGLTGTLPDAIRWYNEAAHTVIPKLAADLRRTQAQARRMY